MGHTGVLETPQHLHNPWARREEVKNSHVRRFINHSQFKSEGFAQLLSVPQTRALDIWGRNWRNCGGQISRPTIKQLILCHSHSRITESPRQGATAKLKDNIPDF